jgi:hypothetical protein
VKITSVLMPLSRLRVVGFVVETRSDRGTQVRSKIRVSMTMASWAK